MLWEGGVSGSFSSSLWWRRHEPICHLNFLVVTVVTVVTVVSSCVMRGFQGFLRPTLGERRTRHQGRAEGFAEERSRYARSAGWSEVLRGCVWRSNFHHSEALCLPADATDTGRVENVRELPKEPGRLSISIQRNHFKSRKQAGWSETGDMWTPCCLHTVFWNVFLVMLGLFNGSRRCMEWAQGTGRMVPSALQISPDISRPHCYRCCPMSDASCWCRNWMWISVP